MAETIITNIDQLNTEGDHLVRDVSSVLTELEPDRYPLDTITRKMPRGDAARAVKVEWESEGPLPRYDTVATACTAGSSEGSVNLYVTNPSYWRADDILRVLDDSTVPLLRVSAVTSTYITIYALGTRTALLTSGLGTVPAIAAGTKVAWLGNAKEDFFYMSTPKIPVPSIEYNFCENTDVVVKVSGTRNKTRNYTSKHDYERHKIKQLAEFRKSLESKRIFGRRSETTDPTSGNLRWSQGGVDEFITKEYTYAANAVGNKITENMLVDWFVDLFAGNAGSDTRFLFADSYLIGELLKVALINDRTRKHVEVLGVKMDMVEFNFGTLYIKHHRLFNELGKNHFGIILDMENVRLRELQPMEQVKLMLKETGYNGEGIQYFEQASLEVRYPATHARVVGISA